MRRKDQQVDPGPGTLEPGSPIREILLRSTALRKAADQLLDSALPLEGDDSKMIAPRSAVDALRRAAQAWSTPVE
jgi:hypothetical protein